MLSVVIITVITLLSGRPEIVSIVLNAVHWRVINARPCQIDRYTDGT
jgi:hypothetical protein